MNIETSDPWTAALFKEQIELMKPHHPRTFQPRKGEFTWTLICNVCLKGEKK